MALVTMNMMLKHIIPTGEDNSPGLNNDNDGCFIAKIGSVIPYDGDWDPNFFIDNSYGKF